MNRQRLSGFSLMEMMVVLLIVSIVAAASAPMVNRKMVADAVGGCKWGEAPNTIFYNGNGGANTVAIGTTSNAGNPRLHIETDNDHPHIRLTNGGVGANIRYVNTSTLFTTDNPMVSGSVIVGPGADSLDNNAVAIGLNSDIKAGAVGSIAIGAAADVRNSNNANVDNYRSIAIGAISIVDGSHSVAVGGDTRAVGTYDGALTFGSGNGATALGWGSWAVGANATAIGRGASTYGTPEVSATNAVAIGFSASATSPDSIAIGDATVNTTAANSIAIGAGASASDIRATALGVGASAQATDSISIGTAAIILPNEGTADKPTPCVSIGRSSYINGENSVAIGPFSRAAGVFENDSFSYGVGATSLGSSAWAASNGSTAIGYDAKARSEDSIAIGFDTKALSESSIVIGVSAVANNDTDSSVVIGAGSKSQGEQAVAIGSGAGAKGNYVVALGSSSSATAVNNESHGVSLGYSSITSSGGVAIGSNSLASGANSIAIGSKGKIGVYNPPQTYWEYDKATTWNGAQPKFDYDLISYTDPGPEKDYEWHYANNKKFRTYANRNWNVKSCEDWQRRTNLFNAWVGYIKAGKGELPLIQDIEQKTTGATNSETGSLLNAAEASGISSIAIGVGAKAQQSNSVALGTNAQTTAANQIVLGTADTTVYIPGNLVVGKIALLGYDNTDEYYPYLRMSEKGGKNLWRLDRKGDDDPPETSSHYYGSPQLIDGFPNPSDRRLKNVGEAFKAGLEELKKLELFHYTYKKDESKTPHVGVMAQDLMKIFPDAVLKGEDGFYRIRMEDMFYALINAVKELDAKIEALKNNEIAELRKRVDDLEKVNAKLAKQNEKIVEQNEKLEKDNEKILKRLNALERKVK